MGNVSQSTSAWSQLKEVYKAAGKDYTGLAEYSDVSGYQDGTNDYVIKAHIKRTATCSGLRPHTRVWPRLDGKNISAYCKMVSSSDWGSILTTDASGNLEFHYKIPNNDEISFRGLKHLLEVSDVKPPGTDNTSHHGISSGKIGATTRCGQYLYFPSNKGGFTGSSVKDKFTQSSSLALTELLADTSKTVVSNVQVDAEIPDTLSQAFNISYKDVDSVRVKRINLYFQAKPASTNSYVHVQIRETGKGGRPTDHLIAQSEKVFQANIPVSVDGTVGTEFKFAKSISLSNNRTYAITVIPNEPDSDFKLWTAVANKADKNSTKKATFNPSVGQLYGSATSGIWSKIPNEKLKFNLVQDLYRTKTTHNIEGNFIFENGDLEFINISDINPPGSQTANTGFHLDEQIRGESLLTVTYTTQPNVGDKYQTKQALNGDSIISSGFANGTVRSIVSDDTVNNIAIVSLDAAGSWTTSSNVYIGATKVGTATSFAANTCSGYATFVNTDFGRLRLNGSSADSTAVKFESGKYVRGQQFGASAKIDSVVNPTIDEISIRAPHTSSDGTTLNWYIKPTTSGQSALDAEWVQINSSNVEFSKKQKQIFSKSNSATKSFQLKGTMFTNDPSATPEAEIDDVVIVAKRQRINSTAANETSPAGDASARYVSKVLSASNPLTGNASDSLIFHSEAYVPNGSDVQVFARAKNRNDSESLSDKNYTKLSTFKSGFSVLGEPQDKIVMVHAISANSTGVAVGTATNNLVKNSANNNVLAYKSGDGSIHHGVDDFQVKVVFTKPDGSGTAYSPQVFALECVSHKAAIEVI